MKIKKELEHFSIDGYYGGSQQWMLDPWMRLGGCGALAAVDSCIFFGRHHKIKKLVNNVYHIDKNIYRNLAREMKPYLRPRFEGINKLSIYIDGFGRFLKDRNVDLIHMEGYSMGMPAEQAWCELRNQIDKNILVPVLLLNPISREWREYNWHWFLINGYREEAEDNIRLVKAVTYGSYEWLHWETFWDENDKENGGMILYRIV